MDSDKAEGPELFRDLLKRVANYVVAGLMVQGNIVTFGFYDDDIGSIDEQSSLSDFCCDSSTRLLLEIGIKTIVRLLSGGELSDFLSVSVFVTD